VIAECNLRVSIETRLREAMGRRFSASEYLSRETKIVMVEVGSRVAVGVATAAGELLEAGLIMSRGAESLASLMGRKATDYLLGELRSRGVSDGDQYCEVVSQVLFAVRDVVGDLWELVGGRGSAQRGAVRKITVGSPVYVTDSPGGAKRRVVVNAFEYSPGCCSRDVSFLADGVAGHWHMSQHGSEWWFPEEVESWIRMPEVGNRVFVSGSDDGMPHFAEVNEIFGEDRRAFGVAGSAGKWFLSEHKIRWWFPGEVSEVGLKMKKCVVRGCENHSDEGRFVGDLCSPCHEALSGDPSEMRPCTQVYRNVGVAMRSRVASLLGIEMVKKVDDEGGRS